MTSRPTLSGATSTSTQTALHFSTDQLQIDHKSFVRRFLSNYAIRWKRCRIGKICPARNERPITQQDELPILLSEQLRHPEPRRGEGDICASPPTVDPSPSARLVCPRRDL